MLEFLQGDENQALTEQHFGHRRIKGMIALLLVFGVELLNYSLKKTQLHIFTSNHIDMISFKHISLLFKRLISK